MSIIILTIIINNIAFLGLYHNYHRMYKIGGHALSLYKIWVVFHFKLVWGYSHDKD